MATELLKKGMQECYSLDEDVLETSHGEERPFGGFWREFEGPWYVVIDDSQWRWAKSYNNNAGTLMNLNLDARHSDVHLP